MDRYFINLREKFKFPAVYDDNENEIIGGRQQPENQSNMVGENIKAVGFCIVGFCVHMHSWCLTRHWLIHPAVFFSAVYTSISNNSLCNISGQEIVSEVIWFDFLKCNWAVLWCLCPPVKEEKGFQVTALNSFLVYFPWKHPARLCAADASFEQAGSFPCSSTRIPPGGVTLQRVLIVFLHISFLFTAVSHSRHLHSLSRCFTRISSTCKVPHTRALRCVRKWRLSVSLCLKSNDVSHTALTLSEMYFTAWLIECFRINGWCSSRNIRSAAAQLSHSTCIASFVPAAVAGWCLRCLRRGPCPRYSSAWLWVSHSEPFVYAVRMRWLLTWKKRPRRLVL